MSYEEVAGLRKVRIQYTDGTMSAEDFLRPDTQIHAEQLGHVLKYVWDLQNKRRPDPLKATAHAPPQARRKADEEAAEQEALVAAATVAAEALPLFFFSSIFL